MAAPPGLPRRLATGLAVLLRDSGKTGRPIWSLSGRRGRASRRQLAPQLPSLLHLQAGVLQRRRQPSPSGYKPCATTATNCLEPCAALVLGARISAFSSIFPAGAHSWAKARRWFWAVHPAGSRSRCPLPLSALRAARAKQENWALGQWQLSVIARTAALKVRSGRDSLS